MRVIAHRKILERLAMPELERSRNILVHIEDKLGSDAYQRLVKKLEEESS